MSWRLHHTANDEWLQAKLLYPVGDASRVPKGINEENGSFSKGVILLRILSIEFWLICDMIVKKNETSLSPTWRERQDASILIDLTQYLHIPMKHNENERD